MSNQPLELESAHRVGMHPVARWALWALLGLVIGGATLFVAAVVAIMNSGLRL